jgi:Flp pilus assembly protein CpaB
LLKVADHVDVLLEKSGTTETLLEHVLVLAVGGQLERSDDLVGSKRVDGSGVTLSVSSEEAQQLLASESQGKLRLVLRNPEDEKTKPQKGDAQKFTAARAPVGSETKVEIEHVR